MPVFINSFFEKRVEQLFEPADRVNQAFSAAGIEYGIVVAAAITWVCAWASVGENIATFLVCFLALGSTLEAIARLSGAMGDLHMAAGYALLVSSVIAFYTATAMMAETYGRTVLALGKMQRATAEAVVSLGVGEPGVVRGQTLNLAPEVSTR